MALPAEHIPNAGDDQITHCHRDRAADPERGPVDKAEKDKTAPARANRAAQSNLRSIIKAAIAPRISAASTAPPPSCGGSGFLDSRIS
jgi:hypothetical protein